MTLLNDLLQVSNTNRVLDVERLEETGGQVQVDFEGSVTGVWVKFDESAAGIVSYRQKHYVTKPIGFTSLRAGTEVELSHANGVYYSKF